MHRIHFLLALFFSFTLISCGSVDVANLNENDFSNLDGGGGGFDCTDSITFSSSVVPIFSQDFSGQSCSDSACHAQGTAILVLDVAAAGADAVYNNIVPDRINASDPSNSLILTKPVGAVSHGGQNLFGSVSSDEYQTILCWIENGAENN